MQSCISRYSTTFKEHLQGLCHKGICLMGVWLFLFVPVASGQTKDSGYFAFTEKVNRDKLTKNLTERNIGVYLRKPLADSTEHYWQEAFYAMQLLRQKPTWAADRLKLAWANAGLRSQDFQRALLRVSYALYPGQFLLPVTALQGQTTAPDIFGLCLAYRQLSKPMGTRVLQETCIRKFGRSAMDTPVLKLLTEAVTPPDAVKVRKLLPILFDTAFAPGSVVVYSLQRHNRNYPGLAIVRDAAGKFIRDAGGAVFTVPQLARSLSNLPACFSLGNTPQGIFRMFGFGRSKISFIGPTDNLQLAMPFEMPVNDFLEQPVTDTAWSLPLYQSMLPAVCRNYAPLWQTYFASAAGRNDIIAHGTTVDPAYYAGTSYFPQTPTVGCLCTKELWTPAGRLADSDQQRLANAVKAAGGAHGYLVVLELDDKQGPVLPREVLPLMEYR